MNDQAVQDRITLPTTELRDLLKKAKARIATDWERDFVREQIERFKSFGEETWFSQKQVDILKKIARREVFDDDL